MTKRPNLLACVLLGGALFGSWPAATSAEHAVPVCMTFSISDSGPQSFRLDRVRSFSHGTRGLGEGKAILFINVSDTTRFPERGVQLWESGRWPPDAAIHCRPPGNAQANEQVCQVRVPETDLTLMVWFPEGGADIELRTDRILLYVREDVLCPIAEAG